MCTSFWWIYVCVSPWYIPGSHGNSVFGMLCFIFKVVTATRDYPYILGKDLWSSAHMNNARWPLPMSPIWKLFVLLFPVTPKSPCAKLCSGTATVWQGWSAYVPGSHVPPLSETRLLSRISYRRRNPLLLLLKRHGTINTKSIIINLIFSSIIAPVLRVPICIYFCLMFSVMS